MAVLAISTTEDGLLAAISPLGLAAAAGTALVIDCDPAGPQYPGPASLAELVARGPTRTELEPVGAGVATLRNGGIGIEAARDVLAALIESWPAVVLRMPSFDAAPWPLIRCAPLLPGGWFEMPDPPAVYQDCGWSVSPPPGGIVLPRPAPATIDGLLRGRLGRRDRWIRAWGRVWAQVSSDA